ncbi:corticotropin-releasing factor receptor 2 [Eurytemora carolleeae]|uniref:corticotropin-releasing factor receptor 2 n=1 Tax=Eurytemora carolleeae TaxID=1294199 RepID=UPI000C78E9FC|nr:corticotropin-releasing factor receptor 2 [Eurytemora carolleeae]|eukprot:XP_023329932.1 corticotropin-releasing factor receptor 2-like [Eurytemora affinis]
MNSCFNRSGNHLSNFTNTECLSFFDGLVCWPETAFGLTAKVPCTSIESFKQIKLIFPSENEIGFAYRQCREDEPVWAEKANYSECMDAISRVESGCESSILFFKYRSLQCDRLRIHRNFMTSLVIFYLITIIYYEPYIHSQPPGEPNLQPWYKYQAWMCRCLISCLMFGYLSPVFWMFIEGMYLHSRLSTNVFDATAPFKIYNTVGWVLPVLITGVWSGGMYLRCEKECWDDYSSHSIIYILIVPMITALSVNLLFLINIVRIIITKLRNQPTLTTQQLQFRKAVRATLILFPLLGITNLLFFINPKSVKRKEHEFIYMLVNTVLKSSQGILISFLYCFFNTEVQEALKRMLRRIKTRISLTEPTRRRNTTAGECMAFLELPTNETIITGGCVQRLEMESKFSTTVELINH